MRSAHAHARTQAHAPAPLLRFRDQVVRRHAQNLHHLVHLIVAVDATEEGLARVHLHLGSMDGFDGRVEAGW